MKKSSTILLQVVVVLIGLGILVLIVRQPRIDSFLVYASIASIALFIALYQVFKLLGHLGRGEVFSEASVGALRTIRYCALTLVAFVVGAEAYLFIVERSKDDIAGGVFMGLLLIVVFGLSATLATVFERTLQNAVDMKSENDLTV